MDEVTQDLEAVSLFDRLLLEELRDDCDARSQLLELGVSVCDLELMVLSLHVDVTLHLFVALDLAEQLPPLGHQLIVSILEVLRSLLAFSEHLNLLLQEPTLLLHLEELGVIGETKVLLLADLVLHHSIFLLELHDLMELILRHALELDEVLMVLWALSS